ncbi:MAG TPA: GT4 family glycosyltransferase PelF [Methylocystis sp.]|jgi:glycosyltransferase involved in cell wall biosynthesis
MNYDCDICLLIEGGYPYVLGGLASWTDGLIRSLPALRFHVMALIISSQTRELRYNLPDNLVGLTEVVLDESPLGNRFAPPGSISAERFVADIEAILTSDDGAAFASLMRALEGSQLGTRLLLESREAWKAMAHVNQKLLPSAPLLDFFWTWRFLARSILAVAAAPLPQARVYHAVSTGYAGLLGARAKCVTGRPFVVTEHGIYTNERRIEIAAADWIYESGASGYDASRRSGELRDLWLGAFSSFSRIAYQLSDTITTQFRANQLFQLMDGAPANKLTLIPNGVNLDELLSVSPSPEPRRPCVLLVGRVVPIKDIRTFILAIAALKRVIPEVEALIIGPADEDPGYAAECRSLVEQQGLVDTLRFLGRVPDIKTYFGQADVTALTSISEAQPLALLEAGAAGLPAVTTDVGSCREILEGPSDDPQREAGGIVVPACDPQATADALAKILLDPPLKQRMGAVMRERVSKIYNEARSARMYSELYRSFA